MSKLLIVESPTKARTISRMLGKDYNIIASMGHIRDLPERELGVNISNHFAPQYVDIPRSKAVVKELKSATKKADEVYLAPDPDREGEAIAWHLYEVLSKSTKAPFYRIAFHEVTRSAIERAIQEKGKINQNLVDAQQARRVLDRIVGYKISPLLWSRIEKGISAGRVQSAALRMVVERDRAISSFVPEEYWILPVVFLTSSGKTFEGRLFKVDGKDFKIQCEEDMRRLVSAVNQGSDPEVAEIDTSDRKRNPAPPFTTSTLQQSANVSLHFSAINTMRYAQQLYEGIDIGEGGTVGLITYMRTDSVVIAKEAQKVAAEFIRKTYGNDYAPKKYNFYKSKGVAQEAHEAIRPTDVNRTPEQLSSFLDPQQLKLYTLIWRRFVASQMTPAISKLTTVDIEVRGKDGSDYIFRASASTPVFAGYTKICDGFKQKEMLMENNNFASDRSFTSTTALLGALHKGEKVELHECNSEQKFTEPPVRYSEASLIKELEDNGIGRPSTYASTLRTIQDRNYVTREQGKLVPSKLGTSVNDFLVERLPALFDIGFTAQMEKELDDIEAGKISWIKMMEEFYAKFDPWLKEAKTGDAPPADNVKMLLALLDGIVFDEPRRIDRRLYDDNKFCESLRLRFAEDEKITIKQYNALLNLIAKYLKSIPQERLEKLSGEVRAELDVAIAEHNQREEERARSEVACAKMDYARLFDTFCMVKFDPPTKRGRFVYDDGQFFSSLKRQALSGKMLSAKQTLALGRLAEKYHSQLTDEKLVAQILKLSDSSAPAMKDAVKNSPPESSQEDSVAAAESDRLLGILGKVSKWATPVKRGRYVINDKVFFESVARQRASGKILSSKQLAALAKLVAKYEASDNE